MSRKLVKAANEKDQKSILKYTKVNEVECTSQNKELDDTSALTSTERCSKLKDTTPTPKRKRSHGSSPTNIEGSKPTKFLNMTRTLEEIKPADNATPSPKDTELDEDESTLSPELAKLE